MILALVIVSMILFLLASFNVPSGPVSLGWLAAFFFVLSTVWGRLA